MLQHNLLNRNVGKSHFLVGYDQGTSLNVKDFTIKTVNVKNFQ